MQKIRRIISIILSVTVLMSVCAVSFGQLGSAATSSSTVLRPVNAVYNFKVDKTGASCYDSHTDFITTGNYVVNNDTNSTFNKSYVDTDGLHLYVAANKNTVSYDTSIKRHMAIIADTDASTSNSEGAFVAQANKIYSLTVKFYVNKHGNTAGVRVGFAVAGSTDSSYGYLTDDMLSEAITSSSSTTAHTFTYSLDSDDVVLDNDGTTSSAIAGRKLAVIALQAGKRQRH